MAGLFKISARSGSRSSALQMLRSGDAMFSSLSILQQSSLSRRSLSSGLKVSNEARPLHSLLMLQSQASPRRCLKCHAGRSGKQPTQRASLHTSSKAAKPDPPSSAPSNPAEESSSAPLYHGPLVKTFARLKLFSLGSLFLASGMTPVLMLAPGEIGLAGRIGLCATALATSGVSTGIIAWIGGPYVGKMKLLSPGVKQEQVKGQEQREIISPALQVETLSWLLRPIRTTIYQPAFIRGTTRPFATWELASSLAKAASTPASASSGQEGRTLVAESVDVRSGRVRGRWWATSAQGEGAGEMTCSSEGKPVRYFNVHDDLLDENWQIL